MAMNCTLIVHSYWFDTCTWQLAHAQPLRSHGCLAAAAASSSRRVQVSQHCATHGYVQELYGYTRLRCSYKQERKSSSFWAALSCRHCSPVACHLWLWLVWKVVVFWSTATRSKQALYLCDSVVFFLLYYFTVELPCLALRKKGVRSTLTNRKQRHVIQIVFFLLKMWFRLLSASDISTQSLRLTEHIFLFGRVFQLHLRLFHANRDIVAN